MPKYLISQETDENSKGVVHRRQREVWRNVSDRVAFAVLLHLIGWEGDAISFWPITTD